MGALRRSCRLSPDIAGAIKIVVAEDEVKLCPALRHCWPRFDRLIDQSEANLLGACVKLTGVDGENSGKVTSTCQ